MSNDLFTQQEIAPEIPPKTDLAVSGSDFTQAVEQEKPVTLTTETKAKKLITTYDITLISVFMSIGVVLNIFSSSLPRVDFFGRASLIYCYCLLCGVLLGAVRGSACAALSDMLVALILPSGGIWMPLITISNLLMALIPGVIYRLSKRKIIFTLTVSTAISFVVCTLGFTAFGETLLYSYFGSAPYYPSVTALVQTGIPVYFAFVIRKAIQQPFWIILNLILATLILKSPALIRNIMGKRHY